MILGLVPARGGSKGIPGKNVNEFCGIPLIERSVRVGLECKFIDYLAASTDSDEIWKHVDGFCGLDRIERPKNLAQDDTPMMPVIQHAMKWWEELYYGQLVDAVVLIDPTNPLRTVGDMEGAWKLFNTKDTDLVVSGCKAKYHPNFNMMQRCNGYIYLDDDFNVGSRQECSTWHPEAYNIDTTVWIYSREAIKQGKRIPSRTRLYLVPPERSASIDTQLDWELAEFLCRRNNDK